VLGSSLSITNTGGLTTLRGAVLTHHALSIGVAAPNFTVAPGATQTTNLTFSTATAGAFSGQTINVVNNFGNVATNDLFVSARVYAPAEAYLSTSTVDFGTVRKGSAATAVLTIANLANGAITDALVPTFGTTPGNISIISTPGFLAGGQSGGAVFGLNAAAPGYVGGVTTIGFTSHNAEMADLLLGSKTIGFTGIVTDPAIAELTKAGGAGIFAGADGIYTLDLGTLARSSGTVGTEFAVLNAIFSSAFAETLGGSFTLSGDGGFSFLGDPFSGLAGGQSDFGNWLRFDTSRIGSYQGLLTFNGFSHFDGLDDLALRPIQVTINAAVVPEPASWAMMIAGFGAIGTAFRTRPHCRRHKNAPPQT